MPGRTRKPDLGPDPEPTCADERAVEAVEPKWASAHGHAVDAARYGALSRPSPSEEPPRPLQDERAEALRQFYPHERELDEVHDFEGWEDSPYGHEAFA